jgi:hypothetical protein
MSAFTPFVLLLACSSLVKLPVMEVSHPVWLLVSCARCAIVPIKRALGKFVVTDVPVAGAVELPVACLFISGKSPRSADHSIATPAAATDVPVAGLATVMTFVAPVGTLKKYVRP